MNAEESLFAYMMSTLIMIGLDPDEAQPVSTWRILGAAWCREVLSDPKVWRKL